jgi:hypothetical protein
MSNLKNSGKKGQAVQKINKNIFIIGGVLTILVIGFIVLRPGSDGNSSEAVAGDLKILKSEVTETVKFYPYKAGTTDMEVMAVKASDGSIRTAFNTCQICHDSGKGYYKQQGDVVVCQNCGNQFALDQIEKIKGGCNPVPIMNENKTDNGTDIVISSAFLNENKDLFSNWEKQ